GGTQPGNLVQAHDGNFYSVTRTGGPSGVGTFFRMTPTGEMTTIFPFSGTNGLYPVGVTLGSDGNFYGVTESGGMHEILYGGAGTVFRVSPSGAFTSLWSFMWDENVLQPNRQLIQGSDGALYGTSTLSGSGFGGIFRITTEGVFSNLFLFDNVNGSQPSKLIQASDGNFY